MRSLSEKSELIKELEYVFTGDDNMPKITGRIYKDLLNEECPYFWRISHYCRLADEGEAYTPGAPYGKTIDEVERKLNGYVNRFETAVDWRSNKYF